MPRGLEGGAPGAEAGVRDVGSPFVGAGLMALLLAVAAAVLFTNLGGASLYGDEANFAAVAERCAENGRCFPLENRHGQPYLHKPPLGLLAEAALFRGFGPSEVSARVLPATAGLLTVLLVFLAGRRRAGPWAGLLAGLVLLGAHGWVLEHGAREGVLDAPVTLCGLVALLAWMRARGERVGRPRVPPAAVAAVLAAGLVKTAHGVLFAALLCLLAVLVRRRGERVREVLPAALAVLGLAVAAEASLAVALRLAGGDRVLATLVRQVALRATTGLDPSHLNGPLFYPQALWRDLGPWLLLAPLAVLGVGRREPALATAHLAAWCAGLLGLASLSVSKLSWYLDPIYPALALLAALGALSLLARLRVRRLRAVLVTGLLGAAAAGVLPVWQEVRQPGFRLAFDSLARILAADPTIAVRLPAAGPRRRLVIWDWWYLQRIARLAGDRPPPNGAATPRQVAITAWPVGLLTRRDGGWRAVAWLPSADRTAGGLWVLATFPVRLPGVPPPTAVDLTGVAFADGFESGAAGGWSTNAAGTGRQPSPTPSALGPG